MMTITIAAITIGIAVDNSIHYIYRFREEFTKNNNYNQTIDKCHSTVGIANFKYLDNNCFWFFYFIFIKFYTHNLFWHLYWDSHDASFNFSFNAFTKINFINKTFR